MKQIYLLTDYNNSFGSKAGDIPYRSGMDQSLLKKLFNEHGYEAIFIALSDSQKINDIKNIPVLYTSSEDPGYNYKSYIEDVVLFLSNKGAHVIPRFEFLRANNNKSFMELIRNTFDKEGINTLKSWSFGTVEELMAHMDDFVFPIVIKSAEGAMSHGVSLAKNKKTKVSAQSPF